MDKFFDKKERGKEEEKIGYAYGSGYGYEATVP